MAKFIGIDSLIKWIKKGAGEAEKQNELIKQFTEFRKKFISATTKDLKRIGDSLESIDSTLKEMNTNAGGRKSDKTRRTCKRTPLPKRTTRPASKKQK